MKKLMCYIIILSIFVSLCSMNFASTLLPDMSDNKVILSIPYSNGIIGISGMDGEGENEDMAPESFAITDDKRIYILDSVNSQILKFYDGNIVEMIKIDVNKSELSEKLSESYMIDIAIAGIDIYVLFGNNIILKIDQNGYIIDTINVSSYAITKSYKDSEFSSEIPVNATEIEYEDNCLNVIFDNDKIYNLSDKNCNIIDNNVSVSKTGFASVVSDNKKVDFPSFSTPVAAHREVKINKYDIYYTSEMCILPGKIVFDRRLYYVVSGKIEKYVQLEQTQFTRPHRQFRIMSDGAVYQMTTTRDSLNIVALEFSADYLVTPSYLTVAIPQNTESNIDNPMPLVVSNQYTAAQRAQAICFYEWTFNPDTNGSKSYNSLPSGVVQPQYLAAIPSASAVVAIPYAWNGSRGIDVEYQTTYNTTFPQAVSAGKYTGNCTSTQSFATNEKCCGLDCSGFVSVIYQLGSKYNTTSLVGSGRPFYYASGSPDYMDIFNKPNDHVFIFYSSYYSDEMWYNIYECTTTYNYRGGNGAHADKSVAAGFYVDDANLTGYSLATLNGW